MTSFYGIPTRILQQDPGPKLQKGTEIKFEIV